MASGHLLITLAMDLATVRSILGSMRDEEANTIDVECEVVEDGHAPPIRVREDLDQRESPKRSLIGAGVACVENREHERDPYAGGEVGSLRPSVRPEASPLSLANTAGEDEGS